MCIRDSYHPDPGARPLVEVLPITQAPTIVFKQQRNHQVNVLLPTGQLPGTIYVDSQFRFDVLPGVHNGCGVAAVDMVESYGQQSYIGFTAMYAKMRGRGLANADGMTNTGWMAKELTLD